MVRRMSSREARANFSDLLGSVFYTNEPVIVEKKGKPVAVLISPDTYERIKAQEEHDWAVIDQIRARNADKDPDEVLADVTAVVEEVRRERYERQQRTTSSHH